MSCECFKIGGPFIGADPECPAHGIEAQAEQVAREKAAADVEARLTALEQRVAKLESERRR